MKTKAHIIYKLADDSRVPGCTTICGILDKPALLEWANRIGLQGIEMRRYVDDKADIGTLAHDMIEIGLLLLNLWTRKETDKIPYCLHDQSLQIYCP
jgi:hypothetical protein